MRRPLSGFMVSLALATAAPVFARAGVPLWNGGAPDLLAQAPNAIDQAAVTSVTPPPRVETSASATEVKLGEPFTVTVRFTHAATQRYELDGREAWGAFELLDQQRERRDEAAAAEDEATTVFTLKLALFELDAHEVPELAFTVTTPDGSAQLTVPGPRLTAAASLPPDAEEQGAALKDLKAPVDVPVRSWRLVWIVLGAVAAAALAYLLFRELKRRRAMRAAPVVVAPLEERTRAALRKLASESLPKEGRVRDFYFRLSEILRAHLGERYAFEALECTGSELIERIDRLQAPELPREQLKQFVEESDLVKFAKMEVDAGACDAALNFGFELVTRTVPQNVAEPRVP